jgi:hypothetical protein
MLLDQQKYFLLHAPRQTGKTTCLLALADYLNREGRYRAVYANIEVAQAYRENVDKGMAAVVEQISRDARDQVGDTTATSIAQVAISGSTGGTAVGEFLTRWCQDAAKPTVLLLDEVDALVGDTLIALLRQLRAGYPKRPARFPQTVILCGVRDLHDYRIQSSEGRAVITGGSAFNIKAESLRLGDFTQHETETLLLEHTSETGQPFVPAALALVWELSAGQPWLVNALAYTACFRDPAGRDRAQPISAEQIAQAKESLIERRVTHLDQLAAKLREPRVRRIIEPILRGDELDEDATREDITYVIDLGLVRRGAHGPQIANPIYREVIPRELTLITQLNLEARQQPAWYIQPDGRLDLPKLLAAFQQFFRENSEIWLERFDYKEAGPHLLLQAFLQRIINGGGRVEREYGLGRGRTDLLVVWPFGGESANQRMGESADATLRITQDAPRTTQRAVIELKVLHKSLAQTISEGLTQTWEYADRCAADEAHLVIFDRRPGRTWEERIWTRAEEHKGLAITVWGM